VKFLRLAAVAGIAWGTICVAQDPDAPKPLPGFGAPVLTQLEDGWYKATFKEVGMTLELPGKPSKGSLDEVWDDQSRKEVAGWAAYDYESPSVGGGIYAYSYRNKVQYSIQERAVWDADQMKQDPGYERVNVKSTPFKGTGFTGITSLITYVYGGDLGATESLFIDRGGKSIIIRGGYWQSGRKAASAAMQRIFKSVRFN
jgi:hypothetical protein